MATTTKPRWTRSETPTGYVRWTCGAYVIERREYTLPVRAQDYVILHDGSDDVLDRAEKLAEAKELAAELMDDDESEKRGAALREQARAAVGKLHEKDAKPFFALFGDYKEAHKVMHRHPKRWARFVELGLADPAKVEAKLCAMTDLGMEVRTVLRVETDVDDDTTVWCKSRNPVYVSE